MSQEEQQQHQCPGGASPCEYARHDAMMALHRLEDAAATLHAECRKLRRAVLAKQRLASKLLFGDTDATRAVGGLRLTTTSHAWPTASQYGVEAERHRALAKQRRDVAVLLRQKAELGELWERLVVRTWYKRVVVAGFYEGVVARLNDFDRRLQRAASVVRPERRWWGGPPAVFSPLCITARRRARDAAAAAVGPASTSFVVDAATATGAGDEAGEADDPSETDRVGASGMRRRRPLRTIIHLFTSVIREYTEQQRTHSGSELFTHTSEHRDCTRWMNSLIPFTLEQMTDVMHHIFTSNVGMRWPCLEDAANTSAQALSQRDLLMQTLGASRLLRRHMETWLLCHFQPQETLLRYRHYVQAVTSFMQERSRATRDLLVTRRQQQERDEARWQSMRARAVTALHPLSLDAATATLSSFASAASGGLQQTDDDADGSIDKSECPLWLVVDSLRQQNRAESAPLDSTCS
ncbi:hypothetical protein TraAM80_07843 [Trypanosoma rangeli]|uniref:Uncharacterized protein n=1 Tax=Trypanosoma rangeli TaxID=5698 RepID=A0A422N3I2_TRYRA|nr:uncharacterized protein TraAM80_07843 [Trypanosoma rangeli]RNF00016.1 hypothetical protein TraAM80_07843 [Trypanosoma rangeli]|eukprot:RNF00016.1 hypothetical protein TraAM80_07843 [Trypanosoma rangeli]